MKWWCLVACAACSAQPAAVVDDGGGVVVVAPDASLLDPLYAAPVCTSRSYWMLGNTRSSDMHPGVACLACHASSPTAPRLPVAGTIYPTGHEPDDCNGIDGAVTAVAVLIRDATGKIFTTYPNGVGNFSLAPSVVVTFPIRAKLVMPDGSQRIMADSQKDGDCNRCHTQAGDHNAPGRIVPPL